MHRFLFTVLLLVCVSVSTFCQQQDTSNREIIFISDTQQPLGAEKILHAHTHQNPAATKVLLTHIARQKAKNIFMLGDMVGLGKTDKMWNLIDTFLVTTKHNGQNVYAVLGNHEVMFNTKKGVGNFEKRFPAQSVRYARIIDSVAVIMLNSNFKKLTPQAVSEQDSWYKNTLNAYDTLPSVKGVIVCCHHAPFTNSTIVNSNKQVQEKFAVPFYRSKKGNIFLSGHSHNFEHFNIHGKDFFVIGGGGGLHQPIAKNAKMVDIAKSYKPNFHYFSVSRENNTLHLISYYINENFNGFRKGYTYDIGIQ